MPERLARLTRQALTLLIGLASAFAAYRLGMPLPWMLGAMLGTTLAAMSGLPVDSPASLRPVVIPVIGVLLGSSLSLEVLRGMLDWLPSMLLLPVFLTTAAALCYLIYRRIGAYDRVTAYFSAVPGGLNEMILFGIAYGGDERRIALAHGVRVLLSVSFIGLVYGLVLGVSSTGSGRPWTALSALTWNDLAWLSAAAALGGYVGQRFRVPAGPILVPMLLSSMAHIGGLVSVPPPTVLVIAAQVVMGSTVGARFAGVRLAHIGRDILLGVLTTAVMISCAFGFSELVHLLAGTAHSQSFLAYAPGGLSEMSLIALAMGQDVAYVSVTHIVRIVLVIIAAPLSFRLLRRGRD
nr:AbrB family transcriptional regulator [Frigidibacter sp. ROC022]